MLTPRPGRLIVSCQPSSEASPMNAPDLMAAMARAADRSGATALRVNSPEHVQAIRAVTDLPVIGLWKRENERGDRIITPDFESAQALAEAGANLVALDATAVAHAVPASLAALIRRVQDELGLPVVADVSTVAEGVRAAGYGAGLVATTLSGYTPYSPQQAGPDLTLVSELVASVDVPIVAEGRFRRPEEAAAALRAGASFVVVGGAITAPDLITTRFLEGMTRQAVALTAEECWAATAVVEAMQATQGAAIREAAGICARAIAAGGAVRSFSRVELERELHLEELTLHTSDVFVIASQSGRNGRPVELALEARRRGHPVVAVTSLADARSVESRHHPGTRLHEVSDVVIDNGAPVGDTLLEVPGHGQTACRVSTVTEALIAQALRAETIRKLQELGVEPRLNQLPAL